MFSFRFLAVLLILPIIAYAETLPIKTYTVADGALRDSVYRIRKDARGFLWLCSAEGISFFDGNKFKNFTPADGLPNRHVNDFLQSRIGNYWIATDSGLALLHPTGSRESTDNPLFTVYVPAESRSTKITVLGEDDEGMLVGTGDGLFRFDEAGGFSRVDLSPVTGSGTTYISDVLRDTRGNLWIGTDDHGLILVSPSGSIEKFGPDDGLPTLSVSVLMEDASGRIWVGTKYVGARLCRLADEITKGRPIVEKTFELAGLPAGYWVLSIFQASDGKVWVGTPAGGPCSIGEDDELHCHRSKSLSDICNGSFSSIIEDRDGNLWIGTQCGTKRWAKYGFTSYGVSDGLAYPNVASMFENRAGEFFLSFALARSPLSRFEGEHFKLVIPNLSAKTGAGWGWKQMVVPDREGDWWIGMSTGLYRFSNVSKFEDLATAHPQQVRIPGAAAEVFRLFEDSRGDIWVQTYGPPNELWRWQRSTGEWRNHTDEAGISQWRLATAFLEDHSGNLWIATGGDRDQAALIRYRDNRFQIFTKDDNELIAGWLRDLFLDRLGRLWIASNATGVLRLDDPNTSKPQFVRYSDREGLATNGAYSLTGDIFGRIYVGSGRGVDRIDPDTGLIDNFSTTDGLPSAEVWTCFADSKGQLWFATTRGLARFTPSPPRVRQPPSVFISGFRVLGDPKPVSVFGETELPHLDLASSQQQIAVDFFGLGSTIGERLRYEYRLPGLDWVQAEGNTVNFVNLAPGDYKFEVRAVTADRLVGQPATASFRIAAPVWQRWWFVTLVAVAVVLVVYLIYRARLARLLELERTRTRIATDLHDDIGSNLSKISLLSELVRMQIASGKTDGEGMLSTIAEISRSSIDSMRDIVWSINPNRDSVLDMTRKMREHAEDVCVPKDILVRFEPDESFSDTKLSMESRRELFLIFKEGVNNAARHSGCSILSIEFQTTGSEIRLAISDNGRGFDASATNGGNGIGNMRARAEKMNGHFSIDSSDNGTSVSVDMPV